MRTCVFVIGMLAGSASAQLYSEDFNTGVAGPEWSIQTVTAAPSGEQFLGRFANATATLTLGSLPAHSELTVSFDLYIINTMDGNEPFTVSEGANTLFQTTFSNNANAGQWFPNQIGQGVTSSPGTGADPNSQTLLQFPPINGADLANAVYHLSFTFPHADSALAFSVSASGLQGISDESWGIDNVVVTPTPGVGLVGVAAGLLAGRRRR